MNNQDYEQKRSECWEEYLSEHKTTYTRTAFDFAFDRAYALGKQEKDGIDLKKLDKMLDDALEGETTESLNEFLDQARMEAKIRQ